MASISNVLSTNAKWRHPIPRRSRGFCAPMPGSSYQLPERYYLVHAAGVVFRVSEEVGWGIKAWMSNYAGMPDAMNYSHEFTDIFGSECRVYVGAINAIYDTTEESRTAAREHDRLIEQEAVSYD